MQHILIKKKVIEGKMLIYDFLVNQNFLGKSKFDLTDAVFDCDIKFKINNKNKVKKKIDKIFAEGGCISSEATLIGLDIEKISSGVDNLETFQDFFDLFNKDKMIGNTKIDSINFTFKLKNSFLYIDEFIALQKNVKLKSAGKYSIYDDQLNLKNDVFIKTKKFNNLPSFKVFINGTKDNYKISYDFEKIKSAVLSGGINSILKNKKKIIINPKSLKGLIDKNVDELKPDKILELFLN